MGSLYSVNGGAFTSASGLVAPGSSLRLQKTASSEFFTKATATVIVGGIQATFDVTTRAGDSVPDAFTFSALTGRERSTPVESEEITLTGFEVPTAISVSGGSYSLNGGAYTSAVGTAYPGQKLKLRLTSSLLLRSLPLCQS